MMKKVKELNKWVIKKKKENESNPLRLYNIFAPDGRFMEENLTFEEAIQFAEDNGDFVSKPRKAKFDKEEFKEFIREGVWFHDKQYRGLVFFKSTENDEIVSLWLNIHDPESMCFSSFEDKDWKWDEEAQSFVQYVAGTYHFGSTTVDRTDEYIYNEELILVEDKLFNVIFNSYENKKFGLFENIEQLKFMWDIVKMDSYDGYRTLNYIN